MSSAHAPTERFRVARDYLLAHRQDYDTAYRTFQWPVLDEFNWALDWFDRVAAGNDRLALWIVEEDGSQAQLTYQELATRSNRVATWLRRVGVRRGDRILLMLGNQVELWEAILAAMKLGAVIIPATPLLQPEDLIDRIERGQVRHVITNAAETAKFATVPGTWTRVTVGAPVDGWLSFSDAAEADAQFVPDAVTHADDTLLLYFTSGTTAQPKLVEHSHVSYPVGHLSTMYWLGLRPGDVHLNVASPGWAKHAWSNFFAPWTAEATVLIVNYGRFVASSLLNTIVESKATTLCAPPTVWRMLIQEDLARWPVSLRECVAAGEPLNPEVIAQVERSWQITIRDGYGQTETTAQIGNPPGQLLKIGSMGRALPGYVVSLIDPLTGSSGDMGEICLDLAHRPTGLMRGYRDDPARTAEATRDGWYHTGDIATRDADGYITFIGRTDDVFKASDYRISPFELESVLLEHEAVIEAAVVPSPEPLRLAVPKAYVTLASGFEPNATTALAILRHAREHLAPYKRVRRLEFATLPKTISGKIRRVDLRTLESTRRDASTASPGRAAGEYWEEDFPDLKS